MPASAIQTFLWKHPKPYPSTSDCKPHCMAFDTPLRTVVVLICNAWSLGPPTTPPQVLFMILLNRSHPPGTWTLEPADAAVFSVSVVGCFIIITTKETRTWAFWATSCFEEAGPPPRQECFTTAPYFISPPAPWSYLWGMGVDKPVSHQHAN